MDNSLVPNINGTISISITSLNPCCNGQQSSTLTIEDVVFGDQCLNPCCNGQQSSTVLEGGKHTEKAQS